jgi:hypothetical protein
MEPFPHIELVEMELVEMSRGWMRKAAFDRLRLRPVVPSKSIIF